MLLDTHSMKEMEWIRTIGAHGMVAVTAHNTPELHGRDSPYRQNSNIEHTSVGLNHAHPMIYTTNFFSFVHGQ